MKAISPPGPTRRRGVNSVHLVHGLSMPGKNTGVGCHFLLQCRKVKSESEVAQSCPTLSDPMDYSPPGSSVHGTLQARVLEWGAIASPQMVTTAMKLKDAYSEKAMAPHSSTLAWKIPWTEEPGGL